MLREGTKGNFRATSKFQEKDPLEGNTLLLLFRFVINAPENQTKSTSVIQTDVSRIYCRVFLFIARQNDFVASIGTADYQN